MTGDAVVCAVALGSNLGDRRAHLDRAVDEIAHIAGVTLLRRSRWIETDPVGGDPDQPRYLNGAVLLATELAPRGLLEALQRIECAHGRQRTSGVRDEPRTLDLDLLVYGDRRIDEPGLAIPHPRLEERWFVLAPLAEIAPDLVLPRCGQTVAARLRVLETCATRASSRDGAAAEGSSSRS